MATLFLLCGLPASGKTTLARRLEREHSAVRLAPDEWMAQIVGDGWAAEKRKVVEAVQWELAQRLLTLGVSVVLENGFWHRDERNAYRSRARDLGAEAKLIYLDVPKEELKKRLVERNDSLPPNTFVVTPAQLDEMWSYFTPPDKDELG